MSILNQLVKHLDGYIKSVYIKNELTTLPGNIILIDENTDLKPESICIGSQQSIYYALKEQPVPKNTVFFVPISTNTKAYPLFNINLINEIAVLVSLIRLNPERLQEAVVIVRIDKAETVINVGFTVTVDVVIAL